MGDIDPAGQGEQADVSAEKEEYVVAWFRFRVSGFGSRVLGFWFRVSGFGSRIQGVQFRV